MELNEMAQMSECDQRLPAPLLKRYNCLSSMQTRGNLPSTAASRDTDTQQQTIRPLLPQSQIPEGSVAAWLYHKSEDPPVLPKRGW